MLAESTRGVLRSEAKGCWVPGTALGPGVPPHAQEPQPKPLTSSSWARPFLCGWVGNAASARGAGSGSGSSSGAGA